ncbi:MAG: hypothetical protein HDQ88_08740 [Clostridia bacterium]|nr:hypothetical protein [Clostridia bacterium]
MPDWKNYEPIPNRHELTLPNGPEIVLYEYESGYRLQVSYEKQEPTESMIRNPKVSVSTELIYTADDLERAKEYAVMVAKMMLSKAVNQLKVAGNHTEFYTQDEQPDEPGPLDGIDPDTILWTDHVVTNKAIRDRTATHLLETDIPDRRRIIEEIKRPAMERRQELFSKLSRHDYQGHCLISITRTWHDAMRTESYFNQIEDDPNLGDVLAWISNLPEQSTVIYFKDQDVHVRQTTNYGFSDTILRLAEIKPNPQFRMRVEKATHDGISDLDDMTIKLEEPIRKALKEQ